METWAGCSFPDEIFYDLDSDTWVRVEEEDRVTIGMTDVSQSRSGRLVHVGWKHQGKHVERGRPLAVIESSKWVGPMRAPVSGIIVATNEFSFVEDIAIANRDPYGEGWFYQIELDEDFDFSALANSGDAFEYYKEIIDESGLRCFRCEE